jgi:hypothetical protein
VDPQLHPATVGLLIVTASCWREFNMQQLCSAVAPTAVWVMFYGERGDGYS